MEIKKKEDLRVGQWMFICCEEDLCQVTDDDIEDIVTDWEDRDAGDCHFGRRVFETREEALAAATSGGNP